MEGYSLTPFGKELFGLLLPIGKLAKNWSKKFTNDNTANYTKAKKR
jgi:DNA-binding HxlR family transcriptional regulator